MNNPPDTPSTRLVTISAFDPDPGRVNRARMGRRNPADSEPRPETLPEDLKATRAELAELRRRTTRRTA